MTVREHRQIITQLYTENDYPSDRLFRNRRALTAFTKEFNARAGASFEPEAIAEELERIRKDKAHTGGLPKLGRSFSGPRFLDAPGNN